MKEFSYALELLNRRICTLDNIEELRRIDNESKIIEKNFSLKTNQLEKIRTLIITSYTFTKELSVTDRINYIRGIAYCKNFSDEGDIVRFYQEIKDYNAGIETESTFFSDLIFEDDLVDEEIEEKEKAKVMQRENVVNGEEIENDFEYQILNPDSIIIDATGLEYNEYRLLANPEDKLNYIYDKFPSYIEYVVKEKNLNTNTEEYKYIAMGMTDWFNRIYKNLDDLFNINENISKLEEKNLLYSI